MKKLWMALLVVGCAFISYAGENKVSKNWYVFDYNKVYVNPQNGSIVCHNTADNTKDVGAAQVIKLNQTTPKPLIFSAESKATNVQGSGRYCLWLDITYTDKTQVFGRVANFEKGTHDWQKSRGIFRPQKPIKHVGFNVLFRKMSGQVEFRNISLQELDNK